MEIEKPGQQNKKRGRKMCKDVSVLNRVATANNHRMVRACFHIRIGRERYRLIRKPRFPYNLRVEIRRETYEQKVEH